MYSTGKRGTVSMLKTQIYRRCSMKKSQWKSQVAGLCIKIPSTSRKLDLYKNEHFIISCKVRSTSIPYCMNIPRKNINNPFKPSNAHEHPWNCWLCLKSRFVPLKIPLTIRFKIPLKIPLTIPLDWTSNPTTSPSMEFWMESSPDWKSWNENPTTSPSFKISIGNPPHEMSGVFFHGPQVLLQQLSELAVARDLATWNARPKWMADGEVISCLKTWGISGEFMGIFWGFCGDLMFFFRRIRWDSMGIWWGFDAI